MIYHNYCRNPDIKNKVWCYTSADDWEYCDIPDCNGILPNNSTDILPNNGTEVVPKNGTEVVPDNDIETIDGVCYVDENIAGCSPEMTDPTLIISMSFGESSDFCQKKCLAIPECSKVFFYPYNKACVHLKDNCSVSSLPEDAGFFYNCSKKTGQLN